MGLNKKNDQEWRINSQEYYKQMWRGNKEHIHNIQDSQTPNRKRSNLRVCRREEETDIKEENNRESIQWNCSRKFPKSMDRNSHAYTRGI